MLAMPWKEQTYHSDVGLGLTIDFYSLSWFMYY